MSDDHGLPRLFFGYPSRPATRRGALSTAAVQIARMAPADTRTWEQIEGASGLIVDAILAEIDAADVNIFDVTDLNENVMFEVGYAIGRRSAIWLVRDPSFPDAERDWKQMRTLTTVRYASYTNSDDIRIAFLKDRPDLRRRIIFDESIGPGLQPNDDPSVLYLHSFYDTDAARAITRRIHDEQTRGIRLIESDPRESAFDSLAWYAQQIYDAEAVVVHFDDPNRADARVHNSRLALVAGLAVGMTKPVLMLAEHQYLSPIDYRDLLYVYASPHGASARTDTWLRERLAPAYDRLQDVARRASRMVLATELKSLRLGQHVAENEAMNLNEYFLRTASYEELLVTGTAIFVGRKGTGKSANALEAAEELREDRRQLVCFIKPYAYELAAVTSLLEKYKERDQKGFVIESLWKFLLYTEIAFAVYREIHSRPAATSANAAEEELMRFIDAQETLTLDFAIRLERTIDELLALPETSSIADSRIAISERLHSGILSDLRRKVVAALGSKVRVAVLIDNLDRAWDGGSHARSLAEFLLGLVNASEQIEAEVRREAGTREALQVAVAVFLRSDIFNEIAAVAPEPDKLPAVRLNWNDPDLRLQVLEERYLAARGGAGLPDELWDRYFCPLVRGVPIRVYLTWRTLPRPRDIVYLANKSIIAAVNHRNPQVEEGDVIAAELEYSQFALEALEVEASDQYAKPIDIFFSFAGSAPVLDHADVEDLLHHAGVDGSSSDEAIRYLRSLTFLGVQVSDSQFAYVEDPRDLAKSDVLAERVPGPRRYAVHPAYRPYLEIEDVDLPAGQLAL